MKNRLFIIAVFLCTWIVCVQATDRGDGCGDCQFRPVDEMYVNSVGFGTGDTQQKAEEDAYVSARNGLIEALRDSVALICHDVKIVHDAGKELLSIQYFSADEPLSMYDFAAEGVLTDTPIVCQHVQKSADNSYRACCVLRAERSNLSHGSDVIMFRILQMMWF